MLMWNQKGIFLAELLAAMTIGVILLAASAPFFAAQIKWGQDVICRIEAQQTARYGMENIIKDAKNCRRALVSNDGKRLDLWRQGSNAAVIRYLADANGILRRDSGDGSGAQPMSGYGMASTKSELQFEQNDGIVEIDLRVTAWSKPGRNQIFSLHSAVKMQE